MTRTTAVNVCRLQATTRCLHLALVLVLLVLGLSTSSSTTMTAIVSAAELHGQDEQHQQLQHLRKQHQKQRLTRSDRDSDINNRRRAVVSGNSSSNSLRPNSLMGRRYGNNKDDNDSNGGDGGFLRGGHISASSLFNGNNDSSSSRSNTLEATGGTDTVSKMQQQLQLSEQQHQETPSSSSFDSSTELAPETRIVGGTTASPGQYPYFVDLSGCGGSLISPNVVLSAAHCSDAASIARGRIRVGAYAYEWSNDDGSKFASVDQILIHPNYDERSVSNDFMLIKLAEPAFVDTTRSNSILRLPTSRAEQRQFRVANTPLTVLGIGTLSEGGGFPTNLQQVEVQTIDDSVCKTNYETRGAIVLPEVMFCAGVPQGGKDSCQGDSGGPIVKIAEDGTHTQVGVTSWGIGCALEGYPGVYADVSVAMDWIESVVCDPSAGWDVSAPFCNAADDSIPIPSPEAPTPSPTLSAQYVLYLEHYTDNLDPFGVFNSPTYYPLVRYTCRGSFRLLSTSSDIQNNPKFSCIDYNEADGFTGLECRHDCDDCTYWWNNDFRNFGEGWGRAAVWFECSGDSVADLEAKFEWVDQGNAVVNVPAGAQATNAKLARLAVRNDFSRADDQLIAEGSFPPTALFDTYVSLANSNPSTSIFLSSTGGSDGGYIAWTGASLCTGTCDVDFANLVITSVPATFPSNFIQ